MQPIRPPPLLFANYQQPSLAVQGYEDSDSVSPSSTGTPEQMQQQVETPLEQQFDIMPMQVHYDMPGVDSNGIDEELEDDLEFDEDGKDYRRFSGRSRKKTDFFGVNEKRKNRNRNSFRLGRRGRRGTNFPYRPTPYTTRAAEERQQPAPVPVSRAGF